MLLPPRSKKKDTHTALKIPHMSGSFDMMACSGHVPIPYFGGRCACGQHQNALIDIDDHATNSDEVQQPLFLRVGSVLNAKEKGTNGQFPEADGIDSSDLTDPRPFRGGDDLRWSEEMNMVAQP